MNKIFKVIWNNAKHCYVVASELAKSYSKGGGSRSIRRAAIALSVAAAVYSAAGSALANSGGQPVVVSPTQTDYVGTENEQNKYEVTITENVTGSVYGHKEDSENVEEASVTMTGGTVGFVYGGWSTGKVASNSVKISDGTLNQHVFGGWSQNGDAASNSVNISGDTTNILGNIYGGVASSTGIAYENKVNIASGTLKIVYGGYSNKGSVSSNSVDISGDYTKTGDVYGGFVNGGTGSASYNIVNISSGAFLSVYGGKSYDGDAVGNSVNISGGTNRYVDEDGYIVVGFVYGGSSTNGTAASNSVNISGGTIYQGVYGGDSSNGAAASNSVNISGGTIDGWVYGGYSALDSESANATSNSVNISGGTIDGWVYGGCSGSGKTVASNSVNISGGNVNQHVFGGWSQKGNAASNSVNISGDTTNINILGNIYGGVASSTGIAYENKVNIATGTLKNVYGGYSNKGSVSSNSVDISGDYTKTGPVYGGFVNGGTGSASYNIVNISSGTLDECVFGGFSGRGNSASNSITISGGTINNMVYGGYSYSGSGSGTAASNTVYISGGTVNGYVYGGYSYSDSGSGAAASNSVNISGGTINGRVYGGYSGSAATSNSVNISGGTINGMVWGGDSHVVVASCSVNISGGTFGSGSSIYASNFRDSNKSNDNSVNLSNIVTGLGNVEIYGFYSNSWEHSGNELHIGKAVDYDNEDKIKRDTDGNIIYKSDATTIWQGKTSEGTVNNLVNEVSSFDALSLYSVAWNTSLPALKATTMENVDTLDVTDLKFYENNSEKTTFSLDETMNLLEWANDGGGVTNLKYKPNGTGDAQTAVLNDTPVAIQTVNVSKTDKGIVLGGTGSGNVKKADKAVQYSVTCDTLNSVDLSNWNGETSTFTATWNGITNVPVVTGSFTDPTNVNPGGSITILTTANASILDTNITGANKYGNNLDDSTASKDFTNDADKGVTFSGKYKKGVKASDDNKSLLFIKDSTKYVTDIALGTIDTNEIRNMNGSDYDFSKVSKIDASNLKIDKIEELNAGDSVNLLSNAANLANNPTLNYGEGKTSHSQEIEVTDNDSGINFTGSMSGSLSTTANAVQYSVDNKFVNKIDLAGWKGTTYNADLSNWTAEDNATIETEGMSTPEEMATGDTRIIIKDESTAGTYLLSDMEVTGSLKWQDEGEFQDTAVKGVSVTGTTSGGGVKISDDYKELIYKKSNIWVDKIKLGQVTFANGGKARTFSNEFNFSDAAVDASALSFADSTDFLKPGDSMTLADKATEITAESSVTDGTDKSINISYSDNTSGIAYKAKALGNVSADTDAVKFTIESVAGESINLSKWNGTTAEFPDVWTANANGVIVAGEFTEPELSAGENRNIITASTAMFKDENIDESIKFAEKGSFTNDSENGLTLSGSQTGGVKATDEGKALTYYALEKTINKFDLAGWDGENSISAGNSWKFAESVSVETDGMSNLPESDEEKQVFILKSDTEGFFANVAINGENAYGKKQNKFTDSDEAERVVLAGIQEKGVAFDSAKTNLVYKIGSKDVTSLKLNTIAWKGGAEILSRDKYNYSKLTSLDTKDFNITYEKPETVEANQSMTLLKANETLADMAAIDKSVSYQYEPLSGVTMNAVIMSRLEAKSGKVTLNTVSNKADKLTFKDIEWLDKGSVIDHKTMLNNVSFNGADVDTTRIRFINTGYLDADMKMTLVSDFGDSVGTITGDKFMVGTAFEGEGTAYLEGSDLVFKTKTAAGVSEQTHKAVMAMEAEIAVIAAGNDHIGSVMESLAMASNRASDGISTAASVGGGSSRYETGSHVDTNSWNIAVAVGKNLEKRDGTMEYGLFAEYGRGNYTLHMDGIEDAGSGNTHYSGGGLLLKWTNKHDVYTEASFRMGNMKDKASSLLHDGAGNAYGYDTSAKYRGGHFGIGKICREEDGTKLEIYGKYFYNEREGINFAAGADQYSLDKVRSRVMRAGFRYSTTQRKWNRYGGLAFDHEFGGKSTGTVNGVAIRSASVKGGTLRGEFGYCREATKTNPWKTDISLYGFTGKRKGFGGNIAFEYHF